MRVILLVTDHQPGGTPLRLAGLARRLRALGVDVHAGCLAPPGPITEQLAADGVETFACEARGAKDLSALGRLKCHVRDIRPDMLHANLFHANLAARYVGWRAGVPVLGSTATIEVERRWHLWLQRATARFEAGHLVNSRTLAEHVVAQLGVLPNRVHVVPPALERWPQRVPREAARAALGLPRDAYVIAWAGRLDPVKRVPFLLDIAERLAGNARCVLAGDGPLRETLRAQSAQRGLGERVRFLGWQNSLDPLLSAADAFCLPSLTEGLPNVVLQAMAAGVPVVATDLPVLRELAGDDGRLLLVSEATPTGTTVPSTARPYAEVLAHWCAAPEAAAAQARRAAGWARTNLDPEATARAVLDAYRRIVHTFVGAGSGAPPFKVGD